MKKSVICIVLLLVVIAAFVVGIVAHVATAKKYCTSKQCVTTAAKLITSMDTRENPCENFYKFACGNFVETAKALNETLDPTVVWKKLTESQARRLFTDKPRDDDSTALSNLKYFYRTCTDRNEIEKKGLRYMKDILIQFGGWPIANSDWLERNFDWAKMTVKLREEGLYSSSILDFDYTILPKTVKAVFKLIHASLDLPEEDEEKVKVVRHIANIAEAFGENPKFSLNTAQEIIDFAEEINKIGQKNSNISNTEDWNATLFTVREVQAMHPQVDWLNLINALVEPLSFTEDEVINFQVHSTITDLLQLLKRTPKRIIANLMLWQVIKYYNVWLPEEIKGNITEVWFNKESLKKRTIEERCISDIKAMNVFVDDVIFAEKYSSKKMIDSVKAVFEALKKKYKYVLKNKFTWMDEVTMKKALLKLDSIDVSVASNVTLKDLPHSQLDFTQDDNYLRAVARARHESSKFRSTRFNLTAEEFSRLEVLRHATEVNAFFKIDNVIMVTPAILQHILYEDEAPKYLQFGLLGFILGHEISHAFHNNIDWVVEDERFVNWWSNQTESKFKRDTKCLVDFYEEYAESEFKVRINGTDTLDENLSDIAGSYVAYEVYQELKGNEGRLPGLEEYTDNQLFWLQNAYFYCDTENGENVEADPHGASSFRIENPAAQLGYFAKDFGCPLGSKMNPRKKCLVF